MATGDRRAKVRCLNRASHGQRRAALGFGDRRIQVVQLRVPDLLVSFFSPHISNAIVFQFLSLDHKIRRLKS